MAAATLVGSDRLRPFYEWLSALPRQTLWVQAARASARAGLLAADGDFAAAAAAYAETVARCDRIGDATDRAIAAAAAARSFLAAGSPEAAAPYVRSTVDFARRNSAHRLLEGLPVL